MSFADGFPFALQKYCFFSIHARLSQSLPAFPLPIAFSNPNALYGRHSQNTKSRGCHDGQPLLKLLLSAKKLTSVYFSSSTAAWAAVCRYQNGGMPPSILLLGGYLEYLSLVVDFDFAESLEDGLPEQQGCALVAHYRGTDGFEFQATKAYLLQDDVCANGDTAVGSDIGGVAHDVFSAKIAVLVHKTGFCLRD